MFDILPLGSVSVDPLFFRLFLRIRIQEAKILWIQRIRVRTLSTALNIGLEIHWKENVNVTSSDFNYGVAMNFLRILFLIKIIDFLPEKRIT